MQFYLLLNGDYIPEQKLCLTEADFYRELSGHDWTKLYAIVAGTCVDITKTYLEPFAEASLANREVPNTFLRARFDAEGLDYFSGWPEKEWTKRNEGDV